MIRKALAFTFILFMANNAMAQLDPSVTSWVLNTTGATGYGGIPSNVQQVQYSTDYVYVSATCIPGYSIGPWTGNPNIPANQNFVFQIPRHPQKNTGTPTATPLGHIGTWTNGVSIFNALDAHSYNNQNVWLQNAYYFEGVSFDNCLGHPDQSGEYHHHASPKCLYDITDSTHHSPIVGFAFDGFPVYGIYAYADTDGAGGIKRMRSSYQLRNITDRTTLPDGTVLTSARYGPAISTQYALGAYIQDYMYVPGSGDLDEYNGRFCVTPEYPSGTYAYFVTVDSALDPVYPYTFGPNYYGVVNTSDVGPTGGHVTITESVTTYTTDTASAVSTVPAKLGTEIYPNPTNQYLFLYIEPIASNDFTVSIIDMAGKTVYVQHNIQPTISYSINVATLPSGTYTLLIRNKQIISSQKIVIDR
jgi:YHYH protein/Secretion system C-terminal sorting domain